jgi:anti-anti-sigma factor
MKIEVVDDGPITVLNLSGNLVIGEAESALASTVARLVAGGKCNFLIDLGGIVVIDSSGLGSLVRAYSAARDAGGEAKFANPTVRTRKLLDLTMMSSVLDIYDDAESALCSFERA